MLGSAVAATTALLAGGVVHCAAQPAPKAANGAVSATPAKPPKARQLYSGLIVAPRDTKPALSRAVQDLAYYLGQATRTSFQTVGDGERGIRLLHTSAPDAPPDLVEKLRGLGRAPYAIRSKRAGELLIVANNDDGLTFGVYQFLESLGFRFYLPNERWTVIPELDDIERADDRIVVPAFKVRQFVGTGGLGKNLVVDPHGELGIRWETWKRRNGFGEEFHIDGHAGESFNIRHKETLLENPEFLASVKGQRVKWSKIAKLDPSNRAALELFVKDRVQAYRDKKVREPDGPGSFAVSVEPADGGGFCDSEDCVELGTVSDQQFAIANAVARELAKEFPEAKASLYAYNLHADVPNIPIEPNVYVTLVPYAFQRNGDDPGEFIERWTKKKSPLSIYDYWSITDWAADQPSFDYRKTAAEKLRLWTKYGIEGFVSESTYSAGAMGLAWYVAGHLMWDPNRDPNQLAGEFFDKAFERAASPMRRMLERWASGFYLTSLELRASFVDLNEAFSLARTTGVRARLVDYAQYLQYLRLRHSWLTASVENKRARKRDLIIHLWRIRPSAMVNSFRLQQLLLRREAELGAELDPSNADLPLWQSLEDVTEPEALGWVTAAMRELPHLDVQTKSYSGEVVRAPASSLPSGSISAPQSSASVPLTLVGSSELLLEVPNGLASLAIQLKVRSQLRLALFDASGKSVSSAVLGGSNNQQSFAASSLRPGKYRLDLRTGKSAVISLTFPSSIGVELQEFRTPKAVAVPDLYFFVPHGEAAVAIYDPIALPAGSGVSLRDSSGNDVPLQRLDGGRLLVARVPLGEAGRVWTLRRAVAPNGSLRMLNVPQRLALTPHALHVPAQALSEPRAHR